MINIKLENEDNKVNVTVSGNGKMSNIIKECTFLINSTTKIYEAVLHELPSSVQLIILNDAIDSLIDCLKKEDNND